MRVFDRHPMLRLRIGLRGAREALRIGPLVWAAQEMPKHLTNKLTTFEPKRLQNLLLGVPDSQKPT